MGLQEKKLRRKALFTSLNVVAHGLEGNFSMLGLVASLFACHTSAEQALA